MKRFGAAFAVFTTALMTTAFALACSCESISPQDSIASADVIFRGTVTSIPSPGQATVRIEKLFKGNADDEVKLAYVSDRTMGCGISLSEGQKLIIAATRRAKDLFTNLCITGPYYVYNTKIENPYVEALEAYQAQKEQLISLAQDKHTARSALLKYGDLLFKYHEYSKAEESYDKVLKLNANDSTALIGRANAKYAQEKYGEALIDYLAVLKKVKSNPEASRGRILSLIKLNRVNELSPSDKDFSGFESGRKHNLSFSGAKLKGANFENAKLYGVSFGGADLRGANFTGASLQNCDFSQAKLDGANFERLTTAYESKFRQASLVGARFLGANLLGVVLDQANLDRADFTKAAVSSASMANVSLAKTKFSSTQLAYSNLNNTIWNGQDLSNMQMYGVKLRQAKLKGVNLRNTHFGSLGQYSFGALVDLRGADLSSANLKDTEWGFAVYDCETKFPKDFDPTLNLFVPLWGGCQGTPKQGKDLGELERQKGLWFDKTEATNSNFAGFNLSGYAFFSSTFDGSNFSGSKLNNADIQGGSFRNVNFQQAEMRGAYLSGVVLSGASFESADLSKAQLLDLDLRQVNLKNATLTDACDDNKTIWPTMLSRTELGIHACK